MLTEKRAQVSAQIIAGVGLYPRLTPWAAFFRRSAAALQTGSAVIQAAVSARYLVPPRRTRYPNRRRGCIPS
jgi:hypothetical protein